MIVRIVALFALVSLLSAISCLDADEEGPGGFTTQDTCYLGETRECACKDGVRGLRFCSEDRTLGACKCEGCTAAPDCDTCTGCVETCLCETGRVKLRTSCQTQCHALYDADSGPVH